ncbi:MAG: 4-(cytidine 5'-diphospho)-2-C-methyl-D-erythritol kinase [Rhodobiaceae bacterium]|nr:MAG: 4-(cytidine 5'-diphospho)-2-C-methyl-D-erythritol kinase [Rhodobiaceae bacterium]
MSGDIVELANAKINLSLRVLGKRADGYHQLESFVMFAAIADRLTCHAADELSLEITGPFGRDLEGEKDNLILEAARVFATTLGRGPSVAFTLEKNLPIASGMGGGSADAAAALRGMIRLWGDPPGSIAELALKLGADVPVCMRKRPSLMTGIGEVVTLIPRLPELHAVLVNPGVAVSTADVFKRLNAGPVSSEARATSLPGMETVERVSAWCRENGNDLEAPAIEGTPEVERVLAQLRQSAGCKLARMSGSGATCFALYDNPFDAAEGAASLGAANPTWWVKATRLLASR